MQLEYSDKVKGMRPSIIRELLKQMSDPQLISFAGGNPAADSFPVEAIRRFSAELLEQEMCIRDRRKAPESDWTGAL